MGARQRNGQSSPGDWMQLGTRFLTRRDRTVAQVERFLASKGASPVQVRQTVRRLSDLSYLNDHTYAQRWVANRLITRPRGRERLKAELQAKGIPDALSDRVLTETFREVDEDTVAHRALQIAQRSGRRLTLSQTAHFLRRRGFSEETIDRMIEKQCIHEETVYEE